MMTDPIADMLTRIRNAASAQLEQTSIPFSNQKQRLAEVLKREGYIADVRVKTEHPKALEVVLRYGAGRRSAILGLRRRSSPGRREYVRANDIPKIRSGLGVGILSTSHGVMTDREAREKHLGGELICEVW